MGTRVMNDFSNPADDRFGHIVNDNEESESVRRSRKMPTKMPMVDLGQESDSEDPSTGQAEQVIKMTGLGIGMGSVIAEHLLSHPCIVLRRQCQIHHTGAWYHLTPISLLQTVINLQRTQGGMVLWKGLGSIYMVKGVQMASESILSELTSFPKEVSRHSNLKKYGGHLLLKSLTFAVTSPFYAASLVETVQSDIASERPGILDVLFEGAARVGGWGQPQTSRLVPIWTLALPTVIFRLSHYVISSIAQFTVLSAVHLEQEQMREQRGLDKKGPSVYETYFPDLLAGFTGGLMADVITYPLQTVLYRLYVQGTRTIIDNTDSGLGVIPINTRYEGVFDCFRSVLEEEGIQGFYRGFGALVAQYAIHAVVLRLAQFLFEYLSQELHSRQTKSLDSKKRQQPPTSELM